MNLTKNRRKRKTRRKRKKVKTDADEEEDDFQESIRHAPSPTRSPTVRSGKRMMCAMPPPLDGSAVNDMMGAHHLLDAVEAGLGVGDIRFFTPILHTNSATMEASLTSSSTLEEDVSVCQLLTADDHTAFCPADQGMSCMLLDIKSTEDYSAVEQGDDTRAAQMENEELYKLAQTIVANLIEPFSGRDASAWATGEDADETEKVLTISTPATPAALQIGIGIESTPTSPKKKKKKNKRKKNPHVLEVNVGTDAASDDSGCECEDTLLYEMGPNSPLHKSSTKKSPKKSLHQQKTAASLAAKTPTSVTSAAGNSMLSSP